MSKTKILICGILPPPNFGHSMMYKALMESAFVAEFDVIFFNMKFWSYEQHKKVTAAKLLKFIQYYFQFIGLILMHRPKYVLYAMSFDKMPFPKDFVFCMTGKLLGRRIIVHDMGQYIRELYEALGGFQKKMLKFMMARVTASIVLGEVTRKVYEGFMDVNRVYAVPGAVADSRNIVGAGSKPARLEDQIEILYFSFLQRSKGVFTALKAMRQVVAALPSVHFTFAGPVESDRFLTEITTYIQANDLERHFTYVGYVGEEEKRTEYFRNCDIYIFPTLRDVFGLVLLHAMAEGRPIVASEEGAIPEIVDDGQTGFLFSKGDDKALAEKILFLIKDPNLRLAMGEKGRQKFEKMYMYEVYAKRMIEVFKKF